MLLRPSGLVKRRFYFSDTHRDRHAASVHLSRLRVHVAEVSAKHATWPQIVQWSYEPALLTYLRVGMHRGERFDAAPEDYLRWIAEGNHDLSEDVRFSARYWLDRRGQPALAGGDR